MKSQRLDFRSIIVEGWQLSKRNRLLWVFGIVFAFLFIPRFPQPAAGALPWDLLRICWILVLILFVVLEFSFVLYGLFYSAGMTVQGQQFGLAQVWNSFKSRLLPWLFLGFISLLYLGCIVLVSSLFVNIIGRMRLSFATAPFWQPLLRNLLFAMLRAPLLLGPFGLLFGRMGVIESFSSGLKVFARDKLAFVLLSAIAIIPEVVAGLVIMIAMRLGGVAVTYETFASYWSSFGSTLLNRTLVALILPIYYTGFAIGYFKSFPAED